VQQWRATLAKLAQRWMGNHETPWVTLEVLRQHWQLTGLFRNSSLKMLNNSDRQHWRSLGIYGWTLMAAVRQLSNSIQDF
jgi:hypothetical protein